jgi:hypothetical protein
VLCFDSGSEIILACDLAQQIIAFRVSGMSKTPSPSEDQVKIVFNAVELREDPLKSIPSRSGRLSRMSAYWRSQIAHERPKLGRISDISRSCRKKRIGSASFPHQICNASSDLEFGVERNRRELRSEPEDQIGLWQLGLDAFDSGKDRNCRG